MNAAIQYGGRAAGALLAFYLARGRSPLVAAAAAAAGWLAGGLVVDRIAARVTAP